jgi:hypothetical protein
MADYIRDLRLVKWASTINLRSKNPELRLQRKILRETSADTKLACPGHRLR